MSSPRPRAAPRRRRDADEDYLRILEDLGLDEGAVAERVTEKAAASNLGSGVFRSLTANFLARDPGAAGDRLVLVERKLEQLYTRPLSPVLPPDL